MASASSHGDSWSLPDAETIGYQTCCPVPSDWVSYPFPRVTWQNEQPKTKRQRPRIRPQQEAALNTEIRAYDGYSSDSSSDESIDGASDLTFDYDGRSVVINRHRLERPQHGRGRIDDVILNDTDTTKTAEVPPFPVGERVYFKEECIVCLVESSHPSLQLSVGTSPLRFRPCCTKFVCPPCMEEYCSVKVNDGSVHIGCPNSMCSAYLHRDEISFHLKTEPLKVKFYKFLIDANMDPFVKTCPRCCHVTRTTPKELKKRKIRKYGLKKVCPECDLIWCFPCQSPWHDNMSCKQYCAGDRLVAEWAREVHYGSRNAQKCPKCLVFIERTEGCDHMSCSYCQTDFCYRCGGRYRSLRFLGSHHSRYSVFGCKYYLKPNKPAQRIFIRSSVLGGKILAIPALFTIGVALLPFAVIGAAIVGPVYGGVALHRYIKRRQLFKPRRRSWLATRGELSPVVLLRVSNPPNRREGVAIPACELTSHFESELDSTQMNEIRADFEALYLDTIIRLPTPDYREILQSALGLPMPDSSPELHLDSSKYPDAVFLDAGVDDDVFTESVQDTAVHEAVTHHDTVRWRCMMPRPTKRRTGLADDNSLYGGEEEPRPSISGDK